MRLLSAVAGSFLLLPASLAWPQGFQWPFSPPQAAPAKPAPAFPFPAFPGTSSAPPPVAAPGFGLPAFGGPFSMFPGASSPLGGFGGASMGNALSPLMSGAMGFLMPFAGNYMIASMNPTTMTNFMGLMMSPQSSPFGSPFGGGFSMFPATAPAFGGVPGFGRLVQPPSPFSFFPGFKR